jgi:hypothetical protein
MDRTELRGRWAYSTVIGAGFAFVSFVAIRSPFSSKTGLERLSLPFYLGPCFLVSEFGVC